MDVFALHRRVKDARAKAICCSVSTMKLACPLINAQARARTHVQMMHQAHNVRCCQYYHFIFMTKRKIPLDLTFYCEFSAGILAQVDHPVRTG